MMLIVALLELHLKQETMDIVLAKNSADEPEEQTANDSISKEEALKLEAFDTVLARNSAYKQDKQTTTDDSTSEKTEESLTPSCHEFIEILGKNVNKYWNIGKLEYIG